MHMGEGQGRREELGKQRRRTFRCIGDGMYRKYSSELERPSPARETVRRKHISQTVKLLFCRKGVRGVHITDNAMDNKTIAREGTLLHSGF
ncbi:hypothetical protein SPSIL_026980 [Sporomusa silvacetica DSM 10669]|uniref:Transposase n=1 Tax=Sporomusa silvacetica DSM 10669 TaxID=1123289 RepID=A0ABZ3ILJ9_9FIRM|nr:hypothetical protein SPSIL_39260 [Sporomusa silvacetica DSM 10669]